MLLALPGGIGPPSYVGKIVWEINMPPLKKLLENSGGALFENDWALPTPVSECQSQVYWTPTRVVEKGEKGGPTLFQRFYGAAQRLVLTATPDRQRRSSSCSLSVQNEAAPPQLQSHDPATGAPPTVSAFLPHTRLNPLWGRWKMIYGHDLDLAEKRVPHQPTIQ